MIQLDPLPWCPEESTPLEPFPPSLAACCNQEADPRLYTASNGSHRRETDRTGLLRLYERLSYHLCCPSGDLLLRFHHLVATAEAVPGSRCGTCSSPITWRARRTMRAFATCSRPPASRRLLRHPSCSSSTFDSLCSGLWPKRRYFWLPPESKPMVSILLACGRL